MMALALNSDVHSRIYTRQYRLPEGCLHTRVQARGQTPQKVLVKYQEGAEIEATIESNYRSTAERVLVRTANGPLTRAIQSIGLCGASRTHVCRSTQCARFQLKSADCLRNSKHQWRSGGVQGGYVW